MRNGCRPPRSPEDVIILQYSIDGGINWNTIHVIDHSEDWQDSHRHYIPLPETARTSATRIRWWQPLVMGKKDAVSWALDNVLIGKL